MFCSTVSGLLGSGLAIMSTENPTLKFPWPSMGNSTIGIDGLSAFFLVPVFLIGGLGSLYGLGYWPQDRHPSNSKKLLLFWGLMVGGMVLLLVSKHATAFLLGWELMALSAFFLVTTEDNHLESRKAGWIYLVSTHLGSLSLLALFSLWRWKSGSFALQPISENTLSFAMMNTFFFLAILGFGLKAGIMPFHYWLPAAHATAPSHVSAILSGVVLKMGIYGLVRWLSLFPEIPHVWGTMIIVFGLVSGLAGVLFAIGQHDMKRLLAYHSIENIGIILMGLGIALLGKSYDKPILVVLGMSGCLLHVWNHSFFKSLLFLCAGSVVHNTRTRQIDQLGGLTKSMPLTATMFLIGAVAICGLPPLNGFISELFVYLGFLQIMANGPDLLAVAFGIPALATIGALAAACFVKVYGAVFLGFPRSSYSNNHHESPLFMTVPMMILAGLCIVIGIVPMLFTGIILKAVVIWNPSLMLKSSSPGTVVPLFKISILSVALIIGVLIISMAVFYGKRKIRIAGTWDCGYAKPDSRMQYTASSFAQSIALLFRWILRPHEHNPKVKEYFPKSQKMKTHIDEIVLDRLLVPASNIFRQSCRWFHRFQHGLIQHYILYILITLFLMICIQMPFKELIYYWFKH
jgi:hydrogenase-4 component B